MLLLAGLAALVFPSLAPLADHHFAERHPAHQHVAAAGYHSHTFGEGHPHQHDSPASGGGGVALYNHDAGPVAVVVVIEDEAMSSFLRFEPASSFPMAAPGGALPADHFSIPPRRPPRSV
ncbi:MAG: hypothetical protein O3A47_00200 [Chloroflexi bacterium]|nr:hypothetical protein [Chloroflexota bacterium]